MIGARGILPRSPCRGNTSVFINTQGKVLSYVTRLVAYLTPPTSSLLVAASRAAEWLAGAFRDVSSSIASLDQRATKRGIVPPIPPGRCQDILTVDPVSLIPLS